MADPKELTNIKEALLGVVTNISTLLNNSPERIEAINRQLYEFNRLSLRVAMSSGVSQADKTLLENARKVVEDHIHPYLEANNQKKMELKADKLAEARQGIEAVKKEIKGEIEQAPSAPTPRIGRPGG